jgi:hypothetical protein
VSQPGEVYWRLGHPWIIISAPDHPSGKLLYVNLTTLDEDCPDDECVLTRADYSWIEDSHPTAVAFSRAKIAEARKFDEAIRQGHLRIGTLAAVSAACLVKIQRAALNSKQLSKEKKELLPGFV